MLFTLIAPVYHWQIFLKLNQTRSPSNVRKGSQIHRLLSRNPEEVVQTIPWPSQLFIQSS